MTASGTATTGSARTRSPRTAALAGDGRASGHGRLRRARRRRPPGGGDLDRRHAARARGPRRRLAASSGRASSPTPVARGLGDRVGRGHPDGPVRARGPCDASGRHRPDDAARRVARRRWPSAVRWTRRLGDGRPDRARRRRPRRLGFHDASDGAGAAGARARSRGATCRMTTRGGPGAAPGAGRLAGRRDRGQGRVAAAASAPRGRGSTGARLGRGGLDGGRCACAAPRPAVGRARPAASARRGAGRRRRPTARRERRRAAARRPSRKVEGQDLPVVRPACGPAPSAPYWLIPTPCPKPPPVEHVAGRRRRAMSKRVLRTVRAPTAALTA